MDVSGCHLKSSLRWYRIFYFSSFNFLIVYVLSSDHRQLYCCDFHSPFKWKSSTEKSSTRYGEDLRKGEEESRKSSTKQKKAFHAGDLDVNNNTISLGIWTAGLSSTWKLCHTFLLTFHIADMIRLGPAWCWMDVRFKIKVCDEQKNSKLRWIKFLLFVISYFTFHPWDGWHKRDEVAPGRLCVKLNMIECWKRQFSDVK